MAHTRLQASDGVGSLPAIGDVNVDERLLPVAVGLGNREVRNHVDVADAIVGRLWHGVPGDDDFAGDRAVADLDVGGRRSAALRRRRRRTGDDYSCQQRQ